MFFYPVHLLHYGGGSALTASGHVLVKENWGEPCSPSHLQPLVSSCKHEFSYYGYSLAHFPEFSWELKRVRIGDATCCKVWETPPSSGSPHSRVLCPTKGAVSELRELLAPGTSSKDRADATDQEVFITSPWAQLYSEASVLRL